MTKDEKMLPLVIRFSSFAFRDMLFHIRRQMCLHL